MEPLSGWAWSRTGRDELLLRSSFLLHCPEVDAHLCCTDTTTNPQYHLAAFFPASVRYNSTTGGALPQTRAATSINQPHDRNCFNRDLTSTVCSAYPKKAQTILLSATCLSGSKQQLIWWEWRRNGIWLLQSYVGALGGLGGKVGAY